MEHRRSIMVALMALMAPLAAQAQAHDSDGDGVPDASDAFPCDPSRASVSYFPGDSTSALLAFEDEWPHHTDLDFNDVVVRTHYRLERDAAGNVVSLHGMYDPVAVGGDFSNGLALQLPVSRTGVTARRRIAGGAWEALTLESDGQATMVLSPNLRELFGNASGRINSIPGQPQLPGQRLELEVTFASPAALSVAAAPFDVFVFRSGEFGHQIHFPQYAGTSAMNTGLFGASQDGSTATRRFVHQSGVPAALNLMTSTRYPLEGVTVSSLFPDIVGFASSGGATHAAFYAGNVIAAQGRDVPALSLPALSAPDTSCTPRYALFTSSATFMVPPGVGTVRVVTVGGGGGGGGGHSGCGNSGGGGGGGRVISGVLAVTPGVSVPVTVGAGGAGAAGGGASGASGGTSSFGGALSAAGGGGGEGGFWCGGQLSRGGSGGSGGGAGGNGWYSAFGGDGGTAGGGGASTHINGTHHAGGAGFGWSPLAGVMTQATGNAGAGGSGRLCALPNYNGGGGGGGLMIAGSGPSGGVGSPACGGGGGRGFGGGGGGGTGNTGAGGAGAAGVVYVEW